MDMEKLSRAIQQARIINSLVEVGLLDVEKGTKVKILLGKEVEIYLREELTEK